jgi:hypothetical protein
MQPQDAVSNTAARPLRVDPDEVSGVLAARRELGPDAEEAVITAFLNRMAQAIDERVDQRIAQHGAAGGLSRSAPASRPGPGARATVALGSMLVGFGTTGVVLKQAGFLGIILALFVWVVIAGINVIYGRDRPH